MNHNSGVLLGDTLKLHCEVIIICKPKEISSDQIKPKSDQIPLETLTGNFGELLHKSQFADVILSVSGKEISAHKAILSAQSPVFAAMFKHKMKENGQNKVIITDISYETMKNILHFIYTGNVPNLDKMADSLFSAADKYDLGQLKLLCENELRSNLSVENAVNTLLLADTHNSNCLKSEIICFINDNIATVKNTDGWKDILKAPHVLMDLYLDIAVSEK